MNNHRNTTFHPFGNFIKTCASGAGTGFNKITKWAKSVILLIIPIYVKASMNNTWGWLGTFTGIMGGLLVAFNFEHSKFGYLFFMISAISWIIQGTKNHDNSLILLNVAFVCVNMLGIYHWFF